MNNNNFLGLPEKSLNALSYGVFFLLACLGVNTLRGGNIALKVANTQLVTSSSANKLEDLAKKLEAQAKVIEQKEQAYQQLGNTYQRSLKNADGYERLKQKIEVIDRLPEVEDINNIREEITETGGNLSEITN